MKPNDKITFRVSPKVARLLAAEATAQKISIHLWARMIVEERLTQADLEQAIRLQAQEIVSLYQSQTELAREVAALRAGLIAAFEVLFVQVAKIEQNEAADWLKEVFGGE